jgi:hypothetical protein
MTEAQIEWMNKNPEFERIGMPRSVQFSQWGSLKADGTYERMDNQPRKPIVVGDGSIGVAVVETAQNKGA